MCLVNSSVDDVCNRECDFMHALCSWLKKKPAKQWLESICAGQQKNTKIFTPKEDLFFIFGFRLELKNTKPPERA